MNLHCLVAAAVPALLSLPGCDPDSGSQIERRSSEYLWAAQAEDGGWHSARYAYLRSGQALTPFVLFALMESNPAAASAKSGIERGLDFLRANIDADRGVLGLADPQLPEYPNDATAFALRCLVRRGDPGDRALIAKVVAYLVSEQFTDRNGFGPDDPAFGGFGMGGYRPPGSPGHMDISYTRHVLDALADVPELVDDAVFSRAQTFLGSMQKLPVGSPGYDGGFYFSPIVVTANKAGHDGQVYRSYATATCDGVIALLRCGVEPADRRVQDALRWLDRHPGLELPGGIPRDEPNGWAASIRLYHLAVRGELDRNGLRRSERAGIVEQLVEQQRPDGSFVNVAGHLMKEDDPILATTLALIAVLGH